MSVYSFRIMAACGAALLAAAAAAAQSIEPAVFVVTYPNAAQGKLSSLTVNPDGTLNLVGVWDTSDTGPQAISLSPGGRYVALSHGTANNIEEKVDVFRVNADATMTFVLTKLVPDSPLDVTWVRENLLAVTQTKLSGDNTVGLYEFDPATPSLMEVARHPTGRFCSSLAMHPHGRFLFANDSTANAIYTIEILPNGTSALRGSLPTGGIYPLGLGITNDGTKVYAGGGISSGGTAVHGYSIDALTGLLAPLPGSPWQSPGASPKLAVASEDDRYVFVGHGTDATLRTMRVESDGRLVSTGYSFDVGLQGTLGKVAVMESLIFVTDNSSAIDGKSGVYSFAVQIDGSLVMNGPDLFNTGSSTPNSIAAWNPRRRLVLAVSDIIMGTNAEFRLTGAPPRALFGLAYSLRGPGRVRPNGWGVTIDLAQPQQAGPIRRADGNGQAVFTLPVPIRSAPLVWFQAVRPDVKSNVVSRPIRF